MPGLTLWMKALPDAQDRAQFEAAQAAMIHAPDYAATVRVSQPGLLVGHVNYAEYPIQFLNAEGCVIGFEGCVYNKDAAQLDSDLREIAALADQDSAELAARIGRWTQEAQGEYVVVMLWPEKKRLLAFTDPFGRLPLYLYADDACLLLAREAKVVQRLKPSPRFDRIGWAQSLWSGYPLGPRTLFEDVERCPGAFFLNAVVRDGRLSVARRTVFTFNFDEKDRPAARTADYVPELVERFVAACGRWGRHPHFKKNLVSLSGGQDSRALAVALKKAGVAFDTATLQTASGDNIANVPLAQEVARRLDVPWTLCMLRPPDEASIQQLICFKDGLNFGGMAMVLDYLEQITAVWGRGALCLTGDGGDKVLPGLHPRRRPGSMDALVAFLAERHARLPMEAAECVMRLAPGTLASELRSVVSAYPEQDLAQKAVHYTVYERGRKWLYEGEDRYRFYLWQTSPFYSLDFFQYCMRIPDNLKTDYRLYRKFQMELDPECARIPDASYGVPPSSVLFPWKIRATEVAVRLPWPVRRLVRAILRRPRPHFALPEHAATYLKSELSQDGPLSRLMSPEAVFHLTGNMTELSFAYLWTLVILERMWRQPREP